jgi:hypothetical protein
MPWWAVWAFLLFLLVVVLFAGFVIWWFLTDEPGETR